jgi:1-acyl-sn-glycerol-3-phosphate acyltransferase
MKRSASMLELAATILEYFLFGVGSLGMIILLPVFWYFPVQKIKKQEYFHKIIFYYFRFLLNSCLSITIETINPGNENFEKPSIIISNHQSMADIFIALSLTPKTIILTKEWVWNSPILGGIAKYADYYCADEGYKQLKEKIGDKIRNGYSVYIFPEGKRSYTGEIDRFHKGAFYLSEELNVDILPVVIHGTINSVPRGTRIIRKSTVVLKYLPRILASDRGFGDNYSERSKNIRRYINGEYEKI